MLSGPVADSDRKADSKRTRAVTLDGPTPDLPLSEACPASARRRQRLATLQKAIGNQAVLRMMANSAPRNAVLQRKCACGSGAGGECAECAGKERRMLRRSPAAGVLPGDTVPPIVYEVLRSPAQSLDAQTRAFMEPRFGQNFEDIRLHTDARAAQSARAVGARAYTLGRHLVFAADEYAPSTNAGRRLLAHELTHVLQQSRAPGSASGAARIGGQDDPHEVHAERVAGAINSSSQVVNFPRDSPGAMLRREIDPVDPDVCRVLREEQRSGTWPTILKYNAITGEPPGQNIIAERSDGTNFDLNWALDVGWVAGEFGGDCSAIVGSVLGRAGELLCAGLGVSAGGLSYPFGRLMGAVVHAWVEGPAAGWEYLAHGSINFENINGADVGILLGASGAIGGEERRIADFVHPRVRKACGVDE